MMRIVALNQESEKEDDDGEEIKVTKEAEETIAVSEYMRALSLKQKGSVDSALTLLTELLDTRVLNEVSLDDKNDKLFSVKYNCHKNIALIYQEKGEKQLALEHFVQAMELDDTEVYAMHRLGQLALDLKQVGIAQLAFKRCLARNPNHWPSADGILQVLCLTENIMEAYGYALTWYKKDENYERAIDVLTEIHEKYSHLVPYFEDIWKGSFKPDKTREAKRDSVFPKHEFKEEVEYMVTPDLSEFRVDKLNWLSVGKFIIALYNHIMEHKINIVFILTVEDITKSELQEDTKDEIEEASKSPKLGDPQSSEDGNTEINENGLVITEAQQESTNATTDSAVFIAPSSDVVGNQTPLQSDSNAEDSDNSKVEADIPKPKPRRRCSDLSFLEQWGWHKNRRYSSRKKSQQDRPEVDTTLNGFLRRIFAKYFEENFTNKSPFLAEIKTATDDRNIVRDYKEERREIQATYDEFQSTTQEEFHAFISELKSDKFDLIHLIFLWLKYVSKFWEQPITEEMKTVYQNIYLFYLNHYDLCTWNHLSNDDFNACYRMALFFLEIDLEKTVKRNDEEDKIDADERWRMLFHHLMFNSGNAFIISDDMYEKNIIRLVWTDYCFGKYENDLNRCVESLFSLEVLIKKQGDNFKLFFPNLCDNNFMDFESIKSTRINLQRKISLNNVKNLYENKKYEDLVEILKDSLVNSTEIKNSDNTLMKIQTQFEVLLESFWNLEKFEECMIWSERCLKHAVDNLLSAPTDTYRYEEWAESVNFILIYIEELILQHTYDIVTCLEKCLSRLVQSLAKILTHQMDAPFDKNNNPYHPVNTKRPWVILHQILQRTEDNSPVVIKTRVPEYATETEDVEELIPHTLFTLFTAHEFLGRRQWCTRDNGQLLLYTIDVVAPKLRAPFMDAYRDYIAEYLEQITYCLYGYPPKKARSRHIEEHDASPVDLTWKRAIQLFDIYRPENLPEFNSYKLDSISADMEQLLLKILPLVPKEIDPNNLTSNIRDFIVGTTDELPQECSLLPHGISCIYYLLADYYFKNRDFSKTIKFYVLDLTCEPTRFDSWAGLALSKASKLETKLNSCTLLNAKEFLAQSEDAVRCFEQCIKLNRAHTLLWIEYGSFAYTIHSFCSRNLKLSSDTLSMEKFSFVESHKDRYLKIAFDCFSTVDKTMGNQNDAAINEDNDSHDEKWLHHFMLGKIAEKRKEHPKVFLDHYLQASNFLYESNATYPIKINHNNPSNLSVEALEIFYRTTSAIIKYLEQHAQISREIGRLFNQVLKDLSSSPFAYNQAKIDDSSINALKRKLAEKSDTVENKQPKLKLIISNRITAKTDEKSARSSTEISEKSKTECSANPSNNENTVKQEESRPQTPSNIAESSKPTSPSRRGSQESTVTTTTTTTGTGTTSSASSSSGSDSSSSDSSSSDSDSGSSSDDEAEKPDENTPLSETELEPIYKSCIRNLEECVTRFSEHYKSIYRLVNHYLHAPDKQKDMEKCRQLLLGSYKTSLGNQIVGLFADRKNNNFFNGIWRIPSSEIDRPGSFSSHLSKCVVMLLEVLRKSGDYKVLLELSMQLYRSPDNDKRYIKESERKELYQQAVSFCVQSLKDVLKQRTDKKDDTELLNFIIDVYKTHKKCVKHMSQKEGLFFVPILVDAYKLYIQDKVAKIPENANMFDLAVKLCVQEIGIRKNQEKQGLTNPPIVTPVLKTVPDIATTAPPPATAVAKLMPVVTTTAVTTTVTTTKPAQIPGIASRPRGRPVGSKNVNSSQKAAAIPGLDATSMASIMAMYGNPGLGNLAKDKTYLNNLIGEYYKILSSPQLASTVPTLLSNLNAMNAHPIGATSLPQPSSSSTSPAPNQQAKVPQFDIKNLIASAANQVAKSTSVAQSSSATISIGSGQLTITPTTSKPTISSIKDTKSNTGLSISSQIFQSLPKSASVSVTKVPTGSPSISVKPLPELMKPIHTPQMPNLPDLPKSLTITPAPAITPEKMTKSQLHPQVSLFPENPKLNMKGLDKYSGKAKPSKKPTSGSNPNPYARQASTTPSTGKPLPQLGNISALASQLPFVGNFNLQNYNQQVNLLNTYAQFLENMGMSGNPGLVPSMHTQFPMPTTQKKAYAKKGRTPKNQSRFPNPQSLRAPETLGSMTIPSAIPKSKPQTFVPPFSLPPSKSPIARSPNPSPGLASVTAMPMPSVTPPLHLQGNQTKTLQQKLAERQKANALHESANRNPGPSTSQQGSKKKDLDVIILD